MQVDTSAERHRRVRLERWGPAQVNARMTDVMRVYRRAFLDVHEAFPARAEIERTAHARSHLHRPGLRAVAALDGDRLVGVGYGQPGAHGQWWHDVVVTAVTERAGTNSPTTGSPAASRSWNCTSCRPTRATASAAMYCDSCWRTAASARRRCRRWNPTAAGPGVCMRPKASSPLLSDFRFPGGPTRYAVLAKRLQQ